MNNRLGNFFLSFNMTFDSTESFLVPVLRSELARAELGIKLELLSSLTKKLQASCIGDSRSSIVRVPYLALPSGIRVLSRPVKQIWYKSSQAACYVRKRKLYKPDGLVTSPGRMLDSCKPARWPVGLFLLPGRCVGFPKPIISCLDLTRLYTPIT